jgi:hypothetical protein
MEAIIYGPWRHYPTHTLNIVSTWREVVGFTGRPLYAQAKNFSASADVRPVGSHSEKKMHRPGI